MIVDVHVAPEFLQKYVFGRMRSRRPPIPLALGGELRNEWLKKRSLTETLGEVRRQKPKPAWLREYPAPKLAIEESKLPQHSSNDRHILALARVSGSRLLASRDEALQEDFRSHQIVPPRKWQDGRNKGGRIVPLGRSSKDESNRRALFATMPPCR